MKTCNECGEQYTFTDLEERFYAQSDIPKPQNCPECRMIRRLNERNARKLYYRTCDYSGKHIFSTYHPEKPFPVYDESVWWSDAWDARDYGREYDFNKPFFEQFKELESVVPHVSVFIVSDTRENSEYTNCVGYIKNCYLISESDYDEDCMYSNRIYHCNDLIDCTNCYECEWCYECIDCIKCNSLYHSLECETCSDSYFLKDCIGCKNCIGCLNQRHKEYMIFNEQLSKEEYERRKEALKLNRFEGIRELAAKATDFFKTQPQKAIFGEHNENVIGDHVYNSKNAHYCYDCKDLEDCAHCAKVAQDVKNCLDYTAWGFGAELVYQSAACGEHAYNLKFCSTCVQNNSNLEYCMQCGRSKDCFGCFGIQDGQYCILNKQYTKEEYEVLREKIITHMKETSEWGEFFPKNICTFGYNETIAMDHFSFTKEEALSRGYQWSDYESPAPDVSSTISASELPQTIKELDDGFETIAVTCERSNKPYKLLPKEIEFYQRMNIPLPRRSPDQRHADRMAKRPEFRLRTIHCSACNKEVFDNISPLSSNEVLCDACFKKRVYGE